VYSELSFENPDDGDQRVFYVVKKPDYK